MMGFVRGLCSDHRHFLNGDGALIDKRIAGLSFLLTLGWVCAVALVFWIYSLD